MVRGQFLVKERVHLRPTLRSVSVPRSSLPVCLVRLSPSSSVLRAAFRGRVVRGIRLHNVSGRPTFCGFFKGVFTAFYNAARPPASFHWAAEFMGTKVARARFSNAGHFQPWKRCHTKKRILESRHPRPLISLRDV